MSEMGRILKNKLSPLRVNHLTSIVDIYMYMYFITNKYNIQCMSTMTCNVDASEPQLTVVANRHANMVLREHMFGALLTNRTTTTIITDEVW